MSQSPQWATLEDVAEINPGIARKLTPDTTVSFVPMAAVSAETGATEPSATRTYAEVRNGYSSFLDGDVLVAKITPSFENGKTAQARLDHPVGFGSTEFHVVRPRAGRADARYLLHFLRQEWVRRSGAKRMTGTAGQRRVPEHFLANLRIPVPSLAEQQRIAALLDCAQGLTRLRNASLERLDLLERSLYLDLFGDPVANTKQWPQERIADVGEVMTGNTPPRKNAAYYGTEVEWIKPDNLVGPAYYATPALEHLSAAGAKVGRIVPPDAVLVTCIAGSRSSIGNAAMAGRRVAFNQQINAFIPTEGEPDFFYAQLRLGKSLVERAATRGMKAIVSKGRFGDIEIAVPPVKLQRAHRDRTRALLELRDIHARSQGALRELFVSLQSRAFQGGL